MLFIVIDSEGERKALLVKAKDAEEVESRLKLTSTQKVVGSFTTAECDALVSASFVVISS